MNRGRRAADGVAAAAMLLKHRGARRFLRSAHARGWPRLRSTPASDELLRRVGDDEKSHMRMLRAAEFAALAAILPRLSSLRSTSHWSGRG